MPRECRRGGGAGSVAAGLPACLALALVCIAVRCRALTQTTTTTYSYNADGAPTAVTTQVDGQAATTVYLTWDNFVPSTTNPGTGAVAAANGNLRGVGPMPGGAYTTEFRYDQRNRLRSARSGAAQAAAYAYYPASLMASSTLASADGLQFYYNAGSTPQATNILQASTATWSSYVGDMTYLSNGTEQMRCQPRKDVAGVYVPAQQTLSPNRYQPYGAPASENSGTASPAVSQAPKPSSPQALSNYDMTLNPFQFAGEYRDAISGLYYLRARWYLPDLQTFTARDPVDSMHRYSYGGGDPIGNVDPSGLSYASFSHDINRAFRPLTHGVLGYVVPLVPIVGQIVGGATLIANLPEVWHRPTGRTWLNFAFLTSSVAVEGIGELPVFDRLAGSSAAFYGRTLVDTAIGGGQTVLSSYHHGKWDVPALVQSIEYNVGGIFSARELSGIGYRPQAYTVGEVSDLATQHFSNPSNTEDALVFRVRMRLGGSTWIPTFTSPLLEAHTLGFYHEGLLVVGPNGYAFTDVAMRGFQTNDGRVTSFTSNLIKPQFARGGDFAASWQPSAIDVDRGFEYAGTFNRANVRSVLARGEPGLYPTVEEQRQALRTTGVPKRSGYDFFANNCHDYVKRMIGRMQQ